MTRGMAVSAKSGEVREAWNALILQDIRDYFRIAEGSFLTGEPTFALSPEIPMMFDEVTRELTPGP